VLNNIRFGKSFPILLSLAAAGTLPCMVQAADAVDDGTLQEIIVTAERRPQSIQRTPIAITAIGADSLAQAGITDLVNAVSTAPAVQVQKSNIGTVFYVRGVGARDSTNGTPISVFQDGIYQQQQEMVGVGFADLNRIEVLRGPQGTIYGRNANGGTVNMITNDPDLNRQSGSVSAQYGNYNTLRLQGVVNVPLDDTLAVRFVGARNQHDGYLSNGLNDQGETMARAKLLWKPTPQLKVQLGVEHTDMNADGPGNILLPTSGRDDPWEAPDYSTLQTIPTGQDIYCSPNCQAFFKLSNTTYRGEISYDLDFATATFLAGIQRFERSYGQPFSGVWEIDHLPVDQETYEFRLNSASSSPVQWVVGAYAFDLDASGEMKYNYTFNQLTDYAINKSKSRAVFGQATVPVTDDLRLVGGLRYTKDSFRRRDDSGSVDGTTGEITSAATAGTLQVGSYKKLTWKTGLEYDLAERSMLYAQYSTGFRSGGVDPNGGKFDPETITAFEVGTKNRFLNNRLEINAATYYYLYKDYQLSYYVYANGGSVPSFIVSNLPGTTDIWGAEFEGQYSLTPEDRLDFSANYQKSKFGEAAIPTACAADGTCTITDLTGRSMPRTPEWTFMLGYEHRFELGDGASVTARVDGQYKSAYDIDLLKFDYSRQGGAALLNSRVTYMSPDERWTLGLYVNNITNKAVVQQANTAGSSVYAVINDPRTYGAVFTLKF
jgi:iron complex outermembrane receptor protein